MDSLMRTTPDDNNLQIIKENLPPVKINSVECNVWNNFRFKLKEHTPLLYEFASGRLLSPISSLRVAGCCLPYQVCEWQVGVSHIKFASGRLLSPISNFDVVDLFCSSTYIICRPVCDSSSSLLVPYQVIWAPKLYVSDEYSTSQSQQRFNCTYIGIEPILFAVFNKVHSSLNLGNVTGTK